MVLLFYKMCSKFLRTWRNVTEMKLFNKLAWVLKKNVGKTGNAFDLKLICIKLTLMQIKAFDM